MTNLVLNWIDVPATNYGLALEPLVATTTSISLDSKEAIQTSHPAYIEIALKGPAGAVGHTGAVGSQGVQGVPGNPGSNGLNGAPGVNGLNGAKGDTGSFSSGTAVGDMQYWNGTAWVMIPAGNKYASLKLCNGVPTWVPGSCPNTSLAIGDTGPAGGKVFYVTDATGLHGLEAAPADQSAAAWGCYGASITGADGTAVGTGAANTADIVAGCAEANTAAKIADAYALNGYTDWYLPSRDELNLLYQQNTVVGGFANSYYWSSSEDNSNNAWPQNFSNGSQYYNGFYKYSTLPVRAVRAF